MANNKEKIEKLKKGLNNPNISDAHKELMRKKLVELEVVKKPKVKKKEKTVKPKVSANKLELDNDKDLVFDEELGGNFFYYYKDVPFFFVPIVKGHTTSDEYYSNGVKYSSLTELKNFIDGKTKKKTISRKPKISITLGKKISEFKEEGKAIFRLDEELQYEFEKWIDKSDFNYGDT